MPFLESSSILINRSTKSEFEVVIENASEEPVPLYGVFSHDATLRDLRQAVAETTGKPTKNIAFRVQGQQVRRFCIWGWVWPGILLPENQKSIPDPARYPRRSYQNMISK